MKRVSHAILLILLSAACAPREDDPWSQDALARVGFRDRAAQLLVVPAESLSLARSRLPVPGGIEITGGDAALLRAHLDSLQRAVARPLLVVARLEGGVGRWITGADAFPGVDLLPDAAAAAEAGGAAAEQARALGIHLARVRGPRTAPDRAAPGKSAWEAYAEALSEGGVLPLLAAFDDDSAPRGLDRAALEAGPVGGLRRAVVWAGGVELGWGILPPLTGDSTPLPISPVADAGLLRRDLAMAGVRAADLSPGGEWRRRYGARAPMVALQSGADLLLGVSDAQAALDTLMAALASGRLAPQRLNQAASRVFALKSRLRLRSPPAGPTGATALPRHEALAQRLHRAAIRSAGNPPGAMARCRAPALAARDTSGITPFVTALVRGLPRVRVVLSETVPLRGDSAWAGGADCVIIARVAGRQPAVVSPAADSAATARRVVVAEIGEPSLGYRAHPWAGAGSTPTEQRALAGYLVTGGAATSASWPDFPPLARTPADSAGMSADSLAGIDRVMRAALAEGVFTGAAVAVVRRGRIVKLAGYGRSSGRPVDPDSTVFDLASLTKVVGTTAAAMALVDDGALQVDAPLRRYLSGFRAGSRGDITIRHLLTHTAGLPAGADLYSGTREPEQALRRVQRSTLRQPPGERYEYSDFGMILLADAMRVRAGQPLDELLQRRVFVPLGMHSTGFTPPVAHQDGIVPTAMRSERPYVLDGVVHDGNAFRLGGVAGHAGLFSTARDVAVFGQAILNGGGYAGQRVWSEATVRRFMQRQGLPGNRALGWDVPAVRSSAGDYISVRAIGHTGYTGTSLWIDPERSLVVVLLTNRTYDRGTQAQIFQLRRRVHDLAVRSVTDQRIRPRAGTAAAREAERPRRRPAPRRAPRRPRRG